MELPNYCLLQCKRSGTFAFQCSVSYQSGQNKYIWPSNSFTPHAKKKKSELVWQTLAEKKIKLKAYQHFEASNYFSYLGKNSTHGNLNASFLSTKRKRNSLTEGYVLHKIKFLQSSTDSIFECVEREFQLSGSWEARSNMETNQTEDF